MCKNQILNEAKHRKVNKYAQLIKKNSAVSELPLQVVPIKEAFGQSI